MVTHAYVRYEDDKRFAVVSVEDILRFDAEETNFEANVYWVRWTGEEGDEDFYRARILIVGDSEADVEQKISGKRVRVKRTAEKNYVEEEEEEHEPPKKKKEVPKDELFRILEQKKKRIHEARKEAEKSHPPVEEGASKGGGLKSFEERNTVHEGCSGGERTGRRDKGPHEAEKSPPVNRQTSQEARRYALGIPNNSTLTPLSQSTSDEVKRLKELVRAQGLKIRELERLNKDLQEVVISRIDELAVKCTFCTGNRDVVGAQSAASCQSLSGPPDPLQQPACSNAQLPTEDEMVDIGGGILLLRKVWTRIELLPKDSLFIKELMTAIWDVTKLLGRSLNGKHCPRFPDRPRKLALTPSKVAVMRECYRNRLVKNGCPVGMLEASLKHMNHYVVEKLADIEKLSKKAQSNQDKGAAASCISSFTNIKDIEKPSKKAQSNQDKGAAAS